LSLYLILRLFSSNEGPTIRLKIFLSNTSISSHTHTDHSFIPEQNPGEHKPPSLPLCTISSYVTLPRDPHTSTRAHASLPLLTPALTA
jgi:hypothetical protein